MNIHNTSVDSGNVKSEQKKVYSPDLNRNAGPYYDPKDIHIHQWIRGNVVPQDSHSKIYSTDKKQNGVLYCLVCHEIKIEPSLSKSTKITSVYEIDNIPIENISDQRHQQRIYDNDNDFEKSMTFVDTVHQSPSISTSATIIKKLDRDQKIEVINKILDSKLFIMHKDKNNNDDYNKNCIMFHVD